MFTTVQRTLRRFLCCLVIASMIAATSLPSRPARADGGSGGDPVTTAIVATTVITFLSLTQMGFLKGFVPRPGSVQVALLMTALVTRAAVLDMLAIRRRTTPTMSQLMSTLLLFTVATYAITVTREMARRRNIAHTVLVSLGLGPLFNGPLYFLNPNALPVYGTGSNDEQFADAARRRFDVVRYGEGPADRPVYRNLFADAAKGDPTARTIVALLPRYHAVGYLPRGSISTNVGLAIMELPGMFLTPFGTAYDAAFWDRIIADAEDAVDCGRCYDDLAEDAYYGDWEAEMALDIADEMMAMEHERRHADQPRLRHARPILNAISDLRTASERAVVRRHLPMLGGRIRVALATETVAEDYAGPTWSVPYGYADGQGSSSIVRKSYNLSADVQYGASYFDLKGGNVAQNRKAAVNEDEPLQYRIGLNLQF